MSFVSFFLKTGNCWKIVPDQFRISDMVEPLNTLVLFQEASLFSETLSAFSLYFNTLISHFCQNFSQVSKSIQ